MGKRRASGEGLLRWRKDRKHWEGRIVIGTNEKGNPISKCFSGKTQKEVVEQMSLYREQLQGQTLSPASRMKLRDWTEKWLNEYMVHLVRPETISNYRRECELHIYPYLGDCQVSKISTVRIQRMYNDLRESGRRHLVEHYGKGLTGTTVRGIHMLLHEIMEYALKEKMILSNPTNGTTIPKIDPTELMVLDEKQLKIFISAIQSNEQWRDFFYLEIMTGLRRGEICALKWSDFDIVERKLHVNRSVTPHGAIGKAKTCYSERVIKLPYSVYQVLVNRKTSAQSEWMFPQPKDLSKPITGESALRQLKVIDRKIAGIKYTEEKTGLQIDRDFKPNKGKRRKGGTGYIKRLSENCWQGRYSPVEDGKRKTYNVYAPTEDECKDKLIRLIEDQKK